MERTRARELQLARMLYAHASAHTVAAPARAA